MLDSESREKNPETQVQFSRASNSVKERGHLFRELANNDTEISHREEKGKEENVGET